MPKVAKSTLIQLILFLGLGASLVYWQYSSFTAEEKQTMFTSMQQVQWKYLIAVLIIGYFAHYFRALRWKQLLEPLNIVPSNTNALFAVLIGYLVNLLIPRAGEIAKCTIIAKYEKANVEKVIGTIVAERAFDTLCLIVLVFITLLVQYDIVFNAFSDFSQLIVQKFLLTESGAINGYKVSILLALLILGIGGIVWLLKAKASSKVSKIIQGILAGLKSILLIRNKGRFLLYTLLIWFCYTFTMNVILWAIPDTMHAPILASLSIIVFGSIGMVITPGGIGAYPAILAGVMVLYGFEYTIGSAFGWVSWIGQTLLVLILGFIALILLPIYNNKYANRPTSTNAN